jgi:hypothetical protein
MQYMPRIHNEDHQDKSVVLMAQWECWERKWSHGSHAAWNQEWLCWQRPAVIYLNPECHLVVTQQSQLVTSHVHGSRGITTVRIPPQTKRSWVRIPVKAWIFAFCVFVCYVLSCVCSGLATGLSPVQRVIPSVCKINKFRNNSEWEETRAPNL